MVPKHPKWTIFIGMLETWQIHGTYVWLFEMLQRGKFIGRQYSIMAHSFFKLVDFFSKLVSWIIQEIIYFPIPCKNIIRWCINRRSCCVYMIPSLPTFMFFLTLQFGNFDYSHLRTNKFLFVVGCGAPSVRRALLI